jgi:hypothetical protein
MSHRGGHGRNQRENGDRARTPTLSCANPHPLLGRPRTPDDLATRSCANPHPSMRETPPPRGRLHPDGQPQPVIVRKPPPPLGPRACANSHPQVRETPPLRAPNATLFSALTARLPVVCGSKHTASRTRIVPRGESGGLPEGRAPDRHGRRARPAPPAPARTMPAGHTDTAAGAAHRG